MDDTIYRRDAIDALGRVDMVTDTWCDEYALGQRDLWIRTKKALEELPSAQPTLYGYNIEQLELIARVLQKEDLPPERVVEALTDIGRIVAIVRDEFEETLRKTVRNIERRIDDSF